MRIIRMSSLVHRYVDKMFGMFSLLFNMQKACLSFRSADKFHLDQKAKKNNFDQLQAWGRK